MYSILHLEIVINREDKYALQEHAYVMPNYLFQSKQQFTSLNINSDAFYRY